MAKEKECGHSKVCADCVKEQIAKKEVEIAELRKKLPKDDTSELLKKIDEMKRPDNKDKMPYVPVIPSVHPSGSCGNIFCIHCRNMVWCGTNLDNSVVENVVYSTKDSSVAFRIL